MSEDDALPFSRIRAERVWIDNDDLPVDERVARLLGDERLLRDLTRTGFTGPDWDFVEEQLLRYGLIVITSWIRSGVISVRCAEKGVRARAPHPAAREGETPVEIALEVISVAIVKFHANVLVPGKYDPKKGAALSTYFIGQCLFQYDNVMAKWENHEQPIPRINEVEVEIGVFDVGRVVGTADDAIRTEMASLVLKHASTDEVRRMLAMSALRYTVDEIATDCGRSVDSVKALLKRERRALRAHYDEGELG